MGWPAGDFRKGTVEPIICPHMANVIWQNAPNSGIDGNENGKRMKWGVLYPLEREKGGTETWEVKMRAKGDKKGCVGKGKTKGNVTKGRKMRILALEEKITDR